MPDATPPPTGLLVESIHRLRRERGAVILAHYYQDCVIQDLADRIGDSLDLSRAAASVTAQTIVFCGVRFMAETAKLLNPDKTVLIPDPQAGCSLADLVDPTAFAAWQAAHPGAVTVTYVNSSVPIKALSDWCCTSSNAEAVIRAIPADKTILFAPDRHLGAWLAQRTHRRLVLWPGSCEVHERFSAEALAGLKNQHPQAIILAHPECPAPVLALAEVVGSTRRLLEAVRQGPDRCTYIVATEPGILHQMRRARPLAEFIPAPAVVRQPLAGTCCTCNLCPHMKLATPEKLWRCLHDLAPAVEVDPHLADRARLPIERMLAIT